MQLRKHWGKGAIALAVLIGGMAVTNPGKEAYADYASVRLVEEVKKAICRGKELPDLGVLQGVVETISSGVGELCRTTINTSGTLGFTPVRNYILTTTTRQNFLIFSIYQTEIPGRKLTTIAAFSNFKTF
jgi:hypothetical protein